MVSKYTFANGIEVPMLGIGLDQVRDIALAQRLMEHALETRYRSVDTAHSFGNKAELVTLFFYLLEGIVHGIG